MVKNKENVNSHDKVICCGCHDLEQHFDSDFSSVCERLMLAEVLRDCFSWFS